MCQDNGTPCYDRQVNYCAAFLKTENIKLRIKRKVGPCSKATGIRWSCFKETEVLDDWSSGGLVEDKGSCSTFFYGLVFCMAYVSHTLLSSSEKYENNLNWEDNFFLNLGKFHIHSKWCVCVCDCALKFNLERIMEKNKQTNKQKGLHESYKSC